MNDIHSKDMKKTRIALKTAAIVVGMNILLTLFKFVVYVISDSLAVLVEAWHSFLDIATSGLVFIALTLSGTRDRKPAENAEQQSPKRTGRLEMATSLCIGVLLFIVSCLLFGKVMGSESTVVYNPLMSGVIFIFFAIGSYFVSTFETQVGKGQTSLGLVSDGMHAKADMFASLLTGISLILYAMGLNIDKWIAAAIAFIIFCLALETFANVYRVYKDKSRESLSTYRIFSSLLFVFSVHNLRRLPETLHMFLKKRLGDGKTVSLLYKTILWMPVIAVVLFYGSTTCYTVALHETAVVERFGKPVDALVQPGFHIKLPWPFDRVVKVDTTRIRELNIGNVSGANNPAFIWTRTHGTEEAFLTGDNNFFYPYIILHYRIGAPFSYLYKIADPEKLLNEIGHKTAVAIFAGKPFYDIATTDRELLQRKMKQAIQEHLDRHKSGIHLLNVNFRDIHPPINIAGAFESVIASLQEKQELINEAVGYANSVVPESRGKAEKDLQSATGYRIHRVREAEGKAKRFELKLPETVPEKDITMVRTYHETMKEALRDKKKIIVDPDVGIPDIWMNFQDVDFY